MQLFKVCYQLYQDYCPNSVKHRYNVSLTKVADESLLVTELRIKAQPHFHRVCQLFPSGRLLERSRFNRRSRQSISIVGSFPLPICLSVRNLRTSIFEGVADSGYNASKHL